MKIYSIKENVCPECAISTSGKDYINREGHCIHVYYRSENDYVYYDEREEEEE